MRLVPAAAAAGAIALFFASGSSNGTTQDKTNQQEKAKTYTYVKDIAPIVKQYCLNCHGEDTENPSELFMDDFASLVKGGKHGPPIVPGKPDKSDMYLKLLPDPPFGKQMPRGRKKITPEDIRVIRDWIEQGAKEK